MTCKIARSPRRPLMHALIAGAALCAIAHDASAALTWNWSYSGAGIAASGSFTTGDTPDAGGFYEITAITGQRNGVAITGLQPAGTAIPGNDPFAVDNLINPAGPQLTHSGFGYSLADGSHSNPFFADFLNPATYLEFYSAAPFTPPTGAEDTELPMSFTASMAAVPEPAGIALALGAVAALGLARCPRAA
ncbi:MAG: hypothetical protein JNJ60_20260 [Rhodocyclaceae bacterium]|nr:hypothetical protein [Rhodocyclaceae bacterium]